MVRLEEQEYFPVDWEILPIGSPLALRLSAKKMLTSQLARELLRLALP